MKKFAFTLQSLLNLKEAVEKQERNRLAALAQSLRALEAEREDMLGRRQRAGDLYSQKLAAGMMAAETQQFTGYFRMMKDLLAEQAARIRKAQGELDACRARLVEVLKEIHMLEKLKEKQYQQYLLEAQQEQDKVIGDFVSYQTTRKPSAAPEGDGQENQQ